MLQTAKQEYTWPRVQFLDLTRIFYKKCYSDTTVQQYSAVHVYRDMRFWTKKLMYVGRLVNKEPCC